jgi:hypothetical protein
MRMRCAEVTNVSRHWCELAKLRNASVKDTTTCGAGVTDRPPHVVTLLERQHSVICIAEVNRQWMPLLSAATLTNFHPACIGIYVSSSSDTSQRLHINLLFGFASWCLELQRPFVIGMVVRTRQMRSFCMHTASSQLTDDNPRAIRVYR